MGCCESKLLDIQPVNVIYEENPIVQNDNYEPNKKDLVQICSAPAQAAPPTDRISNFTLDLQLNHLIDNYEANHG